MIAITSDLEGISETQTIVRFVFEIKKRKKNMIAESFKR
jgi:hypothetical protein